ncbi:MAG: uroporphyrinogen-III synthase [Actinomycetota bacterium]
MTTDPLSGFTIGVTADRRSDEQMKLLTSRGANCIHGPVIKTHAIGSEDDLVAATHELVSAPPDIVVLTTGVGVRGWLEAAEAAHLGDELGQVLDAATLFARGPKAVGALATAGFDAAWRAPSARYTDVIEAVAADDPAGKRVAVQLDGAGATGLCDELRSLGAEVVPVPIYRWSLPDDTGPAERLIRKVVDRQVDAVTFTARPAVDNLFEIAALHGLTEQLADALRVDVEAHCVGPVCAAGITDLGIDRVFVPERHRLGALVQMVTKSLGDRSHAITIGGFVVQLQGRFVSVDGAEAVALTDRERAVLAVLLERPGAVYSKAALLDRVWDSDESDEHVVEVTMARLRQRLGAAAVGIETVFRRGYRLDAA